MKKRYHLYYTFTGGLRSIDFEDINEFSKALDQAIENRDVIQHTITFWTEEV